MKYVIGLVFNKIYDLYIKAKNEGFLKLLSANLLLTIVGFCSQFFVAGFLTVEDLGRIKILQVVVQISAVVGVLGLNSSILKLCSESDVTNDFVSKRYTYGLLLAFTSSSILYLVMTIVISWTNIFSDETVKKIFPIYAISIIPLSVTAYQVAFFQSLRKFNIITGVQLKTKFIAILIVIVLTYFFELYGFILSSLIGFVLTSFAFIDRSRQYIINIKFKLKTFIDEISRHKFYAKHSLLSNGVGQLILIADILIVGLVIKDFSDIGQYAFATTLIIPLQVITSTLQQISSPVFSNKSYNVSLLNLVFEKYQLIINITAVVILAIYYFFSNFFVPILFADKFALALGWAPFLMVSWSLRHLYSLKGIYFWATGNIKITSKIAVLNLLVSIPTYLIMAINYGIEGVILGKIILSILLYLVNGIYFAKTFKAF